MDEEKLTELKKVFADVIFNINKEAARRVKSSEIQAAQYHHEWEVGKEEGVRLLMRIKQMMDFKIHQSGVSSQNQQKKIEELEAQLNEAEDIVKDLRDELGEARSELERDRDLPSMSLRGKEAGLYRNGFTQRIRACERNISDKSSCLLGETDKVKDENNSREQTQRFVLSTEQEEVEDTSKAPASGAKTLNQLEKKLFPNNEFSIFQSFPHKRKRATRVRRTLSESMSETALMLTQVKTETPTHLGFVKSSGKETSLVENSGDIILQKDEGLKETIVPFEDETGFAEILSSPECEIDVEKVDAASNGLEPIYSPSVGKRVIKYTFQRKRKREALSGSKVHDVEIETEEKMGVEQNGDENVEKSKTMESSRDSRRLAQVARQLISLSEKKRWD
ncbi:hypothetical protein PHJA_001913900 [Phtheirospermum japonicum]|uniref:Uncharacterized protein n=1 Tax=Phtheirospermum japonicum TaxID=374723 RepID=A0A830CKB0_9LAMI|nr:hypothetical protein PHJA_001913900 [Phtheirospermum japonicum]